MVAAKIKPNLPPPIYTILMSFLEEEVKRIAVAATKNVIVGVASGLHDDLTKQINDLKSNVNRLKRKCDELQEAGGRTSSHFLQHNKDDFFHTEISTDISTENLTKNSESRKFTKLNTPSKRARRYVPWSERMQTLLSLESLEWEGDKITIRKEDVTKLFPADSLGKSLFHFQRVFGKKGDPLRFNVTHNNSVVKLTHRRLTKEEILKLYETDLDSDFFPISQH